MVRTAVCVQGIRVMIGACVCYESKGYRTVKHEEVKCERDVVLVYDVMEKMLV